MRIRGAVLSATSVTHPYADSPALEIRELELDEPADGEVLVRIVAAGLCHSDLSVIDGSRVRPLPMLLGHEASGVVERIGPGVADVVAGDHVVLSYVPSCGRCVPCQSGRPALCEPAMVSNGAGTLPGGGRRLTLADGGGPINHHLGVSAFADHAVVSQASLVRIDPAADLATAAVLGCAVLTGVGAVINTAAPRPGSSAVVFGLGGVGLSAVMGARLAGCHPIVAVDIVPAKLELALELGATHAVRGDDPDLVATIRELTGGGGETVIEAVGRVATLELAYAATRRGGTTVAAGLPAPDQRMSITPLSLVAEERTLKGSYMGSGVPRRDVPRLLALARDGRLPVERLISSTLPLDDINAGFDRLADGSAVRQLLIFD
jgi:Zn-dependent alcohol dehydrogenase